MASSPPFQVEDSDEDFFDKLVNDDDDDYKVTPLSELTNIADGNNSDDTKAFSNLDITDVGTVLEDLGKGGIRGDKEDIKASSQFNGDIKHESSDTCIDPSHKLVSSNSFAFDSTSEEQTTGLEEPLDSIDSWNHGSVDAPGVKEVQWTAFTTQSVVSDTKGFGSYDDFFTEFGENSVDQIGKGGKLDSGVQNIASGSSNVVDDSLHMENVNYYSHKFQEVQGYATADVQDPNSIQLWENLYPGWKYDANTGQWCQVNEGYDVNEDYNAAEDVQGAHNLNTASELTVSNDVSYLQQTVQSAVGAVGEKGMTESVNSWSSASQVNHTNESLSKWDQASQQNNWYPSHMVFDPQYPGWYYDTNTQEWCSLDAYNSQPIVQAHDQVDQNGLSETNSYYGDYEKTYDKQDQLDKQSVSEAFSSKGQDYKWEGPFSNVEQQGSAMWQPAQEKMDQNGFSYGNDEKAYGVQDQLDKQSGFEGFSSSQGKEYKLKGSFHNVERKGSTIWQPDSGSKSVSTSDFKGYQYAQNSHGTSLLVGNHVNQHQSFHHGRTASSFTTPGQLRNEFPAVSGAQTFVPSGNLNQPFSHSAIKQSDMMNVPKIYDSQKQSSYSQQLVQSDHQVSYASTVGRSSAGRPPHALVTFGFGGKVIVMKDTTALMNPLYTQGANCGSISVHSLAEIFTGETNMSSSGASVRDYFDILGLQSFPGPLAGGNVGGKELSKWIDERITHSGSSSMDYRNSEGLKLLLSLLKIASQHYGKLRSPFGTDATLKENDAPEVAVARLFASVRKTSAGYGDYGHFTQCLQQLPSEREIQVTAAEVQTLLVSGRKIEALQRAQEGRLWGPALVLAAQLGDQFYVDTVRKMALRQLVAGSPLRTLCLLIAGQPADAFSSETTTDGGIPGAVTMSQQAAQTQPGSNCMLEDWEENLAMITANRTKDDELVLIHLGDCLWKERRDIIAAHICYLVAEANFEPYSDTARLCLIGADHWKHPRTYASPEAIQRTEVYEYTKLLGNSQFTLLPFQPYKLLYAHMLAEVGLVSDSLKYCQLVLKSIKTSRAPEVETWRQMVSSLEDRIKTHLQGGFSTNLAPAKLVGKLLNLFDSTAHRVVGGLPPPVPSTSGSNAQNDHYYQHQPTGPRVSTSQSTMAMSSLVPSASMEPINQWSDDANRNKIIHNRSVSEPDFGRSPKQVDPSKENSAGSQTKASGGTSRFGPFGFGSQLLQKTMGLVLKPRGDKQAKLGESNKFHYDEKLKRWVEEGVDPPSEEAGLPPPPTTAAFQNGRLEDYNNSKNALKSEASRSNGSSEFTSPTPSSGIPPIPAATSSNQFSSRGRLGVRARYVDTFNQGRSGGNPTNLFHSPPTPAIKPTTNTNPKFFVPSASLSASPSSSSEVPPVEPPPDNTEVPTTDGKENHSFSSVNNSLKSFPPAMARQKFSSMDNVSQAKFGGTRRIASWSGNEESFSLPNSGEQRPTSFMAATEPGLMMHSSVINDDLQDVDL